MQFAPGLAELLAPAADGAGAAARYSVGLVIFSGITIGTIFTLFVVPAFYTLISKKDLAKPAEEPISAQ